MTGWFDNNYEGVPSNGHHRFTAVFVGPEDHHTTTVEAAARYERDHCLAWDSDIPDTAEILAMEEEERLDQMRTPRAGL